MNERYLYRGKRKDNREWAYGGLDTDWGLEPKDRDRYWIIQAYLGETLVIPETVGQCTGLTDKNDKLIFEGDIVKIVDFQVGIVTNECGAFGVGVNKSIDWDYLDSEIAEITGCNNMPYFCKNDNFISLWELMWNYNQEDFCEVAEVIGNIHDNPELLEVEK